MRHLRIGAFSFALVLGGLACTPLTPPRSRVAVPLHAITSDEILHTVDLRWHSVQDVRALARISVRSAKGRYSARETFLWSRPATLRLETLNVAGQPFMALVADPEGVSIYYPHEGVFFQGPSSATNLARFIGLPLDVEDVAHLLTGYIKPGPRHPWAWTHYQQDQSEHLLRFLREGGDLLQDVWLEPERLLPTRILRYNSEGASAVDVAYADFRPLTDTFPFPFRLTISLPLAGTELRLQFLAVDLNPGLPPDVFQLSPPEGTQVVPLE